MFNLNKYYFHLSLILSLLMFLILFGFNEGVVDELQVKGKRNNQVDSTLSTKEQLGKLLFFEKSLSTPTGQACADCHAPEVAFADPGIELPVSKGAHPDRYGNRNDMTVSYSSLYHHCTSTKMIVIGLGDYFGMVGLIR